MTAFFQGTWSGMGMIQDLDRGVIERFLATPARRTSLVLSQVIRSGITSLIQGLIILLVALPLGASNGGPVGWVVILLAGGLISAGFAGISQGLALLTRKEASMIAVANFIGLPLMFFSSMLIARSRSPTGCAPSRRSTRSSGPCSRRASPCCPAPEWEKIGLLLLLLVAFTATTTAFATWAFRAYQRTL